MQYRIKLMDVKKRGKEPTLYVIIEQDTPVFIHYDSKLTSDICDMLNKGMTPDKINEEKGISLYLTIERN